MNPQIRSGIDKVSHAIHDYKDMSSIKESIKILLTTDIKTKLDFISKADYNNPVVVKKIANLLLFENDKFIKIEFGKNAKNVELALKEHNIDANARRHIGEVLAECSKEHIKYEKELKKQQKQENNNNNNITR